MYKKQRGFTLIEMIVSIGVIGVLATLTLVILNPFAQFQKANDAKRKSDLASVQKSLEQYYQDFGKYPQSDASYRIVGLDANGISWGGSWQPYMNVLPKDPLTGRQYAYYAKPPDYQSYWLYAGLEKSSDAQVCNKGNACASISSNGLTGSPCGSGVVCNFGLSSPNVAP